MDSEYHIPDETAESVIELLRNEIQRSETLGDDTRVEQLKVDLGVLEAQYAEVPDPCPTAVVTME